MRGVNQRVEPPTGLKPGTGVSIKRVAFIGTYLPRQCGIGTFTTDLAEAIAAEYPQATCMAVPINDTETGYAYPPRVRFEIAEDDIALYRPGHSEHPLAAGLAAPLRQARCQWPG